MPRHFTYLSIPGQRRPKRILRAIFLCVFLLASTFGLASVGSLGTARATVQSPAASASSANGLVINEAWDSQTAANEYFELYNTGSTTINLSTYVIYNRDGNTPLSNLDSPTIGPGEFRAIGPSQLHTNSIGGPTGLSQNDFLGLVNTSPSDAVIDVVNWGGQPNVNWTNYDRFRNYFFTTAIPTMPPPDSALSLQRWPDGVDMDSGTDFAQIQRSPNVPSCADPSEGTSGDDSLSSTTLPSQDPGTTVLHRLCPSGDRDVVQLSLSSNFTYTLQTSLPSGSQANTLLQLYSADNVLLAQDDNATSNSSIIRFRPSSSGTYKAAISDSSGRGGAGASWLYYFAYNAESGATATPTTPTPGGCTDAYEPDDQSQQAKLIALNTQQTHLLCHPDGSADTDWVTFQVSGGKVYTFLTQDLSTSVDTIISLYTTDGTKLDENDDYGQGLASRIDYSFANGGSYLLRVRNKTSLTGAGYQYTLVFTSSGQPPFTSTPTTTPTINPNTPTATTGPCTDAYEPDGVSDTAKLILIGTTQHHSFCPSGDADWARFYARAGKVYTIKTSNLGAGVDTYLWLFDSNGHSTLAYNDDGGAGDVSSSIDFYPLRDDYYFVQVKNAGDIGGADQTYDLSLAVVPGAPQPPSTATGGAQPPAPTSTSGGQPTVVVQPTQPPLPSPTQGALSPTPAVIVSTPTLVPPAPVSSQQPTAVQQPPTATMQATATVQVIVVTVTPEPPSDQPTPTATAVDVVVPNPPKTGELPGGIGDNPNVNVIVLPTRAAASVNNSAVSPPKSVVGGTNLAPLQFDVFYDRNGNNALDANEGIKGLRVYFLGDDTPDTALGTLITGESGSGNVMIPRQQQRVYVPYLGINMPLANFPGRELHSIWLPGVKLPSRVP